VTPEADLGAFDRAVDRLVETDHAFTKAEAATLKQLARRPRA